MLITLSFGFDERIMSWASGASVDCMLYELCFWIPVITCDTSCVRNDINSTISVVTLRVPLESCHYRPLPPVNLNFGSEKACWRRAFSPNFALPNRRPSPCQKAVNRGEKMLVYDIRLTSSNLCFYNSDPRRDKRTNKRVIHLLHGVNNCNNNILKFRK